MWKKLLIIEGDRIDFLVRLSINMLIPMLLMVGMQKVTTTTFSLKSLSDASFLFYAVALICFMQYQFRKVSQWYPVVGSLVILGVHSVMSFVLKTNASFLLIGFLYGLSLVAYQNRNNVVVEEVNIVKMWAVIGGYLASVIAAVTALIVPPTFAIIILGVFAILWLEVTILRSVHKSRIMDYVKYITSK